jgi:hypothetical protein
MASHATFAPAIERDFSVAAATRFDMIVFVVTFIHFTIYHHTPTIMRALATAPLKELSTELSQKPSKMTVSLPLIPSKL